MKTSWDMPDDLYRRVKAKSALEGRAVREVATALFSAWVEGRINPDATGREETPPDHGEVQRAWLARWRALATDLARVTAEGEPLLAQLQRDRR